MTLSARPENYSRESKVTLEAEDYQGITATLVRANLALDQADIEAWVACFATDGVFRVTDPSGAPVTLRTGQDELRAYATAAARSSHGAGVTRRWNGNILIDGGGDAADASSYLIVATTGRDQKITATGLVHDQLIRIGGAWRLQEREVRLDGPSQ
jgi:3-phenylpropionate/cinnamic acid dioxygenase small subunit